MALGAGRWICGYGTVVFLVLLHLNHTVSFPLTACASCMVDSDTYGFTDRERMYATSGWKHCGAERLWHLAMIPPLAYGCGGYLGDCLFMAASCVWHHLSLFNGMHWCGWQAKTGLTWRAFCAAVFCYFFASPAGFYTGPAFSGKGSWRGKAQARLNALMPGYLVLFLIDMTSDYIHF